MTDESLKPGDVVQLKSGGPAMTITRIDRTDALCQWFVGGEHKFFKFPVIGLKLHDDQKSASGPDTNS